MKSKSIRLIALAITSIIGLGTALTIPTHAESIDCDNPPDGIPQSVLEAAGCSGTTDNLPNIIINVLNAVIGIAGLVAVIFVIIGGFQYMTSTGDPGKTKKAKDTILYAVIGLAVCALAFAIVNFFIGNILKAQPATTEETEAYIPATIEKDIAFFAK